jgi:GxxExxY protein
MNEDEIGKIIVDSTLEVHKHLGPGLLENAYEGCLKHELELRGLKVSSQQGLPLIYKGKKIEVAYRLDLFVEEKVIIELKSVEKINEIHWAQIISYLKLADIRLGYLINFNVKLVKDGVHRIVNKFEDSTV